MKKSQSPVAAKKKEIYCVGWTKGGTGKSTLALALAHHLAREGKSVKCMNLDTQNTIGKLVDWAVQLGAPPPFTVGNWSNYETSRLASEIDRVASEVDALVIDCGGQDDANSRMAIGYANSFLIVLDIHPTSLLEVAGMKAILDSILPHNPKLNHRVVLNKVTPGSKSEPKVAREYIRQFGLNPLDNPICLRKSIADATAKAGSIYDVINEKTKSHDTAAASELTTCFYALAVRP